ncbi:MULTISPECIES: TerB N-terminal domain-containing protein [Pandoraea]|nr:MULTISPECIES: TerB N-terminal domain-containing protein [Pandoraea]
MHSDHFFEAQLKSDKPEVFVIRSSPNPVRPQDLATHWVPPGVRVQVRQYSLPDGLVYLCSSAERNRLERTEPSLIDESLQIGREEDFTVNHLPYYPTYEGASPTARAAYINWLISGRRHPNAGLGYVYLFFYGLERRAIIDARSDQAARDEIPAICAELEGLIETYKNGTFNWRARQLLAFCRYIYGAVDLTPPALPLEGNPHVVKDLCRIGLSQAYHERHELPAKWLATWYISDGRFNKPAVVKRHQLQFAAIFQDLCDRQFRNNLATWSPPLSTKSLQLSYQPVSMVLSEVQESVAMADLTCEEAGLGRLVETIALSATEELTRYSRYVARSAERADDPVSRLMLPCPLWPGQVWERLALILAELNAGVDVTEPSTLAAFLAPLDADDVLTKIPIAALLGQMDGYMGIGVEPDPRHGSIAPSAATPIVFFRSGELPLPEASRGKSAGLLPVHLKHHARVACVAFLADLIRMGLPNSAAALEQAKAIALEWGGLTAAAHVRLQALLIALTAPEAPEFKGKSALKKQLALIDAPDRVSLTHELVAVARAGGALEQVAVVRQLEKYFALLGADPKALYDMAHTSLGLGMSAPPAPRATAAPGVLDTARIAALRKETARVDTVLGSIFTDDVDGAVDQASAIAASPAAPPDHNVTAPAAVGYASFSALPSLDARHSDLLRAMLAQATWTGEAFAALCAERGLMSSGAIERINDAAFDAFDEALLEGDDPIEFNPGPLAELRS